MTKSKGPFDGVRDDWQSPGPSGPATKARAAAMRKPPFANRERALDKIDLARRPDLVGIHLTADAWRVVHLAIADCLEDFTESTDRYYLAQALTQIDAKVRS